jgi:hypothetical protein
MEGMTIYCSEEDVKFCGNVFEEEDCKRKPYF